MATRRPPRVRGFAYTGPNRYFITICTLDRHRYFLSADLVDVLRSQLLTTAAAYRFAVLAYCFMPDHLHALLEAVSEDSDFLKCVYMFKQRSAFSFRKRQGAFLCQEGFYDRTLRNDEQTSDVAAYILANPVRAGLCEDPLSYPFAGSGSHSTADLAAMIQSRP